MRPFAYEPDGVRLVPVRQFGADRLDLAAAAPAHAGEMVNNGARAPGSPSSIALRAVGWLLPCGTRRRDGREWPLLTPRDPNGGCGGEPYRSCSHNLPRSDASDGAVLTVIERQWRVEAPILVGGKMG
ncbi:MAG: hypothetical protein ACRDQU_06990 [Pseudonocardiaceae bacterium]